MDELTTGYEQAIALLAGRASMRADLVSEAELAREVQLIEAAGRLIDALRVLRAAEVERRSDPAHGDQGMARKAGHHKPAGLLAELTGASPQEVSRRLSLGRQLLPRPGFDGELMPADLPVLADGMRGGAVGMDAAETIARHLKQVAKRHADPDNMHAAELALTEIAARGRYWEVTMHAIVWREALDPDGARPREEQLRQERRFTMGRERNGMTPFSGQAPPAEAALLRAVFGEAAAPDRTPRFLEAVDADEAGKDGRTTAQRHFDILIGFFRAGVRAPMAQRSTAQVMAVVSLEALQTGRGVAWLDDVTEPISAFAAQVTACSDGFQTLITGQHGEALALGRRERYFTAAQRKAMAGRDGPGCVIPGCEVPHSWADGHHVLWFGQGGLTDIGNGVLICTRHHTEVHQGRFELRMVDGRPQIRWTFGDWQPAGNQRATVVPPSIAA